MVEISDLVRGYSAAPSRIEGANVEYSVLQCQPIIPATLESRFDQCQYACSFATNSESVADICAGLPGGPNMPGHTHTR